MGYLDNVPEDKAFILGDRRLLSLRELHDALSAISDDEFNRYVGTGFNYFADWIYHVVGHSTLADSIKLETGREASLQVLDDALKNETQSQGIVEQKVAFEEPAAATAVQTGDELTAQAVTAERPAAERPDRIEDVEELMRKISKNENEIKDILWKHFAWDLAKEFMYGMAVGILIGFILSRILLR